MVFAYVKNSFVLKEKAVVSIEERGFRFGDGVFETIRIYDTIPYQWELHFTRLFEGLQALKIDAKLEDLYSLCCELIQKNNVSEGFLRISISRGIGGVGYLPRNNTENTATLVIETLPLGNIPSDPVDIWISNIQKISSRSLPVHVKLMQSASMILTRIEAQEHNCFESLLLGDRAQVCEGSSSNIFWYRDKTLFTPSLRSGILAGTMRDAVIRLSPFKVKEGLFLLKDLFLAEEVFLTNVSWQVLPVRALYPMKQTWNNFDVSMLLKGLVARDISTYAAERKQTSLSKNSMG